MKKVILAVLVGISVISANEIICDGNRKLAVEAINGITKGIDEMDKYIVLDNWKKYKHHSDKTIEYCDAKTSVLLRRYQKEIRAGLVEARWIKIID